MQRLTSASTAKFADSAQSGGFNHGHASQMAHAAALKQQAARALSGLPTARPPVTPGGHAGTPGGGISAPVAQIAQATGRPPAHVHAAINNLVGSGKLTPLQGTALKMHNKPLQGPAGANTMKLVASALPQAQPTPMPQLPVAGQRPMLPKVPQ